MLHHWWGRFLGSGAKLMASPLLSHTLLHYFRFKFGLGTDFCMNWDIRLNNQSFLMTAQVLENHLYSSFSLILSRN